MGKSRNNRTKPVDAARRLTINCVIVKHQGTWWAVGGDGSYICGVRKQLIEAADSGRLMNSQDIESLTGGFGVVWQRQQLASLASARNTRSGWDKKVAVWAVSIRRRTESSKPQIAHPRHVGCWASACRGMASSLTAIRKRHEQRNEWNEWAGNTAKNANVRYKWKQSNRRRITQDA